MYFQSVNGCTSSNGVKHWLSRTLIVSNIVAAAFLGGCGGGGSSSGSADNGDADNDKQEQGQVEFLLTDAEGDFTKYEVGVTSLFLVAENGTEVEIDTPSSTVDFAQYVDLTEFFTVQSIRPGNYTQVKLNLVYTDSDIFVQREDGEEVEATAYQEIDGELQLIEEFSVEVNLPLEESLQVRPGAKAAITIDFDLDSSNEIRDLESDDPKVVVEPFILASAKLDNEREHRGRGLLESVDTEEQTFTIDLKPFRHFQGNFGDLTLYSSDETDYEINGNVFLGAEGIDAMAGLEADTPVLVYGQVEGEQSTRQFNALYVRAGTSVPWVGRESVRGVVVARDGDVLTLRGPQVVRLDGHATFLREIEVSLGDNTKVTRQLMADEALDEDDVSIGQTVLAFGELEEVEGTLSMNATEGHVQMVMNVIKGQVISTAPLTVDLDWINARRPAMFDFSGTNADPDAYVIDTGSLSLDNIDEDSIVRLKGYPVEFGSADPEDFAAQTVININTEQRAASLDVLWLQGTDTPFTSMEPEQLVVNSASADAYLVKMVGVPLDMDKPESATIAPFPLNASKRHLFAIKVGGEKQVDLYTDFSEYVSALTERLNEGKEVRNLMSLGRYNQVDDSMSAVVVTTRLIK